MKTDARKELDTPERQNAVTTLVLEFPIFFLVTLVLDSLSVGFEDGYAISWFEIGFHILCAVAAVPLMWEFLSFSWLTVGLDKKIIAKGCFWAVVIIYSYYEIFLSLAGKNTLGEYYWCASCTLPIATNTLYATNIGMITLNPVFGTACAVLIAPIVTCCMFYATVFPKKYNVRPWLGYLAVAVVTLLPRVAMGVFGWWSMESQLGQYVVQLPTHLICCWLYAKTDNIWAPIFAQTGANILACIEIILTFL